MTLIVIKNELVFKHALPRNTVWPVQMLRLIQFLQVIASELHKNRYELKYEEIPSLLARKTNDFYFYNFTTKNARNVLNEISKCNLCALKKNTMVVESDFKKYWDEFNQAITYDVNNKLLRWNRIDDFFYKYHDMYKKFCNIEVKDTGLYYVVESKFNKVTAEVLIEWSIRLNRVQQNLNKKDRIYFINKIDLNEKETYNTYSRELISEYFKMSKEYNEKTINLPLLAEHLCEKLRMSRSDFLTLLKSLYDESEGRMWLGTGLIDSHVFIDFETKFPSILDTVDSTRPWYEMLFYHNEIGLPQYYVKGVPRRFISIKNNTLRVS